MATTCTIPDYEEQIGGEGTVYAREHRILLWRIYDVPNGTLQNIDGWTTRFVVKTSDRADLDTISKAGTIIGTYNVDPTLNTQYVQVELTAADLDIAAPRTYRYALWRTDTDNEDVLRAGPFDVQLAGE